MAFNGTGTFVRIQNWTNDATNNLPISATKFDVEANDWASGLTLCLTRDGQGVPSSALSWAQPLTLNRPSDGPELTLNRTGGTNNPALAFSFTDTGGVVKANVTGTTAQLQLAIQGTTYFTLANTGALTLNAPSGNAALVTATASQTFGNSTDNPTYSFAGSGSFTTSTGTITIGGARGSISSAGAWVLPAPTAGIALSVTGLANQYAALFTGSSTSGQSFGARVNAGTTTADRAVTVRDQTGTNDYFVVRGDGALQGLGPVAAALVDMTPDNGSFTGTLSGMSSATTGPVKWRRMGNFAALYVDANLTGTSNSIAAMVLSGIPASIQPAAAREIACAALVDNGVFDRVASGVVQGSTVTFFLALGTPPVYTNNSFTASGTKGLGGGWTVVYPL